MTTNSSSFETRMVQKIAAGDFKTWNLLDPDTHSPDPVVMKLGELLPVGSSVFEYGAGRGRNALPLLAKGFRVSAQDAWGDALEDLRIRATAAWWSATTQKGDAAEHEPETAYDAFVCIRMLHFLHTDDAWRVLSMMRKWTKPEGFNAVSFYVGRTHPIPGMFYPSEQELIRAYEAEDWKIVVQSEICPSKPGESTNGETFYQKAILFRKSDEWYGRVIGSVRDAIANLHSASEVER